eukprot:TRINITY_DN109109_c0_g1_i1.p1 TRINITY_DN109109_c0_g1~~TRINITY_DN109109_c0_g1_i1.p1  ORF type:complete len:584 (-),score=88.81 TRINITY_DN109109_c0_g1_i1:272-1975(-)
MAQASQDRPEDIILPAHQTGPHLDVFLQSEVSIKTGTDALAFLKKTLEEHQLAMKVQHQVLIDSLTPFFNDKEGVKYDDVELLDKSDFRMPAQSQKTDWTDVVATVPADESAPQERLDSSPSKATRVPRSQTRSHLTHMLDEEAPNESERWWHAEVLVRSNRFEMIFALLILLNCAFMAVQAQVAGDELGRQLSYPKYELIDADSFSSYGPIFDVIELGFGILFGVEILLKIIGYKLSFVYSAWNWSDLFICILWAVGFADFYQHLPLQMDAALVLRAIRLVRLLRFVRLARRLQGLDSLVVMTTALEDSLSALFWVAVLLLILQTFFAIVFTELLSGFLHDESVPYDDRIKVFEYFGSFSRSILSMFELMLANWTAVARILQERVAGAFVIVSILHKVIFGFACVGVINGVFMQETLRSAQADDTLLMRDAQRKIKTHTHKMEELFLLCDADDDGVITEDEWVQVMNNSAVKSWLAGQGLNAHDAEVLFRLIESSDRTVSPDALAQGIARLQGPARSLDLMLLQKEQLKAQQRQEELFAMVKAHFVRAATLQAPLSSRPEKQTLRL